MLDTRCFAVLFAAVLATAPSVARAQESAAPPAASAAPPPASAPTSPPMASASEWDARFAEAHQKLVDGVFDDAALALEGLVATAPDDVRRALASQDAKLARAWAKRGLVLMRRADLADDSVSARATGRRTTDEIALLYTNAVFYGLGTGGWIAELTQPSTAAGNVLPALGLAAGSAGLVALLDSGRGLRYGVPQSITTGLYLGLEEGLLWTLYNQASARYSDQWSGKTVATVVWGSATIGAVGGALLGEYYGTTPGRASYVGSTSFWGSSLVGLFSLAAWDPNAATSDDHELLAMALGLNAGAIVGVLTANEVSPSVARMRFVDLGGIAGGIASAGLFVALQNGVHDNDLHAFGAVTGLGVGAGLALAWYLTRHMPVDRPEAKTSWVGDLTPGFSALRGGGGTFTLSAPF